jgi:hypothetical protein
MLSLLIMGSYDLDVRLVCVGLNFSQDLAKGDQLLENTKCVKTRSGADCVVVA